MYIEIISYHGVDPVQSVRVKVHEGFMENEYYDIKPGALLPLIWQKKILITTQDIRSALNHATSSLENDPVTKRFFEELSRLE